MSPCGGGLKLVVEYKIHCNWCRSRAGRGLKLAEQVLPLWVVCAPCGGRWLKQGKEENRKRLMGRPSCGRGLKRPGGCRLTLTHRVAPCGGVD